MNFFSGYTFFVYLVLFLIPAVILGFLGKNLRYYRIFLTIFFIWSAFKETPMQLLYLLAYAIGAVYLVKIYVYLRTKYGRNKYIYGHAVLIALIPLLLSKISVLYGKNIFCFLGISYICFRVIQVVIETYDGVISDIDEICFLEFILFFPSLSSGPIDRSRRFFQDAVKSYSRAEYAELFGMGLYKLITGVFYKVVCSACLYDLLTERFTELHGVPQIIGYVYVYGFYLFFDFAGYSLMAVGTSYILGIRMPDNFNKPFLSTDMKDFWNRWHITLSAWFRDFIFTRFMVDSARKKRFKNRLSGAAAGLMLNMTVMGIWHGIEAHYIAYGIYHGFLLACTEIYQKKSGFYRNHKDKIWYQGISWLLTLNMVMFGFLVFSGRMGEILNFVTEHL